MPTYIVVFKIRRNNIGIIDHDGSDINDNTKETKKVKPTIIHVFDSLYCHMAMAYRTMLSAQ